MPFDDFETAPGETFGEWHHAQIAESVFFEAHGFMPNRVRTAAAWMSARLHARPRPNRGRTPSTRSPTRRTVRRRVPWLSAFTAFTAPGKYVYFSRRLLERCPHEEAAAFVIAHEIAHHDLGHLAHFSEAFARRAAALRAGALAILFFRILQKRIYSPEREIAAGYEPGKCLFLFHILELFCLDYGDTGAVFGPDAQSAAEVSPEASVLT